MNHNDVDHDDVDHDDVDHDVVDHDNVDYVYDDVDHYHNDADDDDVDHDLWHLLQLRGSGSKKSTLRPSFASLSHHACLICFLKICCLSDMFFKDLLLV